MLSKAQEIFQNRSDQKIIRMVRDGHKELFEILLLRYQRKLLNFLTRFTGSLEDAKDLTQEAFLNAYFNLDKFDTKKNFSPWLFTIGHHLAVNHHHKSGRLRIIDIEKAPEFVDNSLDILDKALKNEHLDMVRANLASIDLKYRTVLELRYLEDKSYEEISRILNIPINTVKSRLFRAKNVLAEKIGTPG
ncbi:RNA polymerase sigma factor [Candidatus Parcubacteria bacterium]|nr:MAG: RNA polymerase sigma factor [Candidatus Parcubacteria bacterium]